MSYFAPYLDETGLHMPTYEDRMEAMLSSYRSIFGSDINISESAPDYQMLSIMARALDDVSALLVSVFSSRNPAYASGEALDLLMPLMGLVRNGPTYSECYVTLTGTPNAILSSAPRIMDRAGYIWACVTGIHIGSNGKSTIRATCETPGAISAPAGSICYLVNEVEDLVSAVNENAATPGVDAETDASARHRMRLATTASSISSMEALRNDVLSLQYALDCKIYENDGDATDIRGIPGHSICLVAQGGGKSAIGNAIFKRKAPGIGTFGNQLVTVVDTFGFSHTIRFKRASTLFFTVQIFITPRTGFDEASVVPKIKNGVYEYLSKIGIGEEVVLSALYGIAYSAVNSDAQNFLITNITGTKVMTDETTTQLISPNWDEVCSITGLDGVRVTINT